MGRIVGSITTAHVPSINRAIAKGLEETEYWRPFFAAYPPAREWLASVDPDVVICVYNDHGLNFFLDKMPPFAIGAADEYRNADEGWGIPVVAPLRGDARLSWQLIEALVEEEFDLTTCQEMLVDHAVTVPMGLLWRNAGMAPPRLVPISVNTVQFPLPTARRCYRLGEAIGRAVRSLEEDLRVVVVGTGGLSHQLEGSRAGFINRQFDLQFVDSLIEDPTWATRYSIDELVTLAGTQGIELLMWLIARATMEGGVRKVWSDYHAPISNTGAGL